MTKRSLFLLVLILTGCAAFGQSTKPASGDIFDRTAAAEAQKARNSTTANGQVGRYQIFFSPLARADVYLLDTETGRIWRPTTVTNARDSQFGDAPEIWIYQERIDDAQQFERWKTLHSKPEAPASPLPQSR